MINWSLSAHIDFGNADFGSAYSYGEPPNLKIMSLDRSSSVRPPAFCKCWSHRPKTGDRKGDTCKMPNLTV